MPSSTVENYLKTIYLHEQEQDGRLVPMGVLAQAVGVTPGTATTMIKTLHASELVEYEPRTGVRLTEHGTTLALHVLRRHRLIEQFLVEVLKLDWSEVHAEAEVLEHAISDKVLDAIDALLGQPRFDPHGDPIPSAAGEVHHPETLPLLETQGAGPFRLARIMDQDPQFLRFLDARELRPGVTVHVRQRCDHGDSIELQRDGSGESVTLGLSAAAKLIVETV